MTTNIAPLTRPCIMCGRPDQSMVEVSLREIRRTVQLTLCQSCYAVVEPYGIYPHPETCKCRGTMCRHVGEVMVDDPCEEPQDEQEPYYAMDLLHRDAIDEDQDRDHEPSLYGVEIDSGRQDDEDSAYDRGAETRYFDTGRWGR